MSTGTIALWDQDAVKNAAEALSTARAEEIVRWGLATFGPRTAVASSFSEEDVAVIHLAASTGLPFRVVALDTGRLHEETRWVGDQLQARYGIPIEWYFPLGEELEELTRTAGMFSFRRSLEERRRCCEIRKVGPLRRALEGTPAWFTGLRRDQSQTRASLPVIEWDVAFGGLVKLNPLAGWTDAQLRDLADAHGLPRHALYDEGYTSIGCAPCSRPTRPGEHPRSGRWWWEDPAHAECGLHPLSHRTIRKA
ncbi:MAG: phosphoadenylyl-sulfate reductase [Deltaproteobacteria bacterium]|nr:phosphoadenylyl-sulfate reductase [Deltaproteobacteria bacterium]